MKLKPLFLIIILSHSSLYAENSLLKSIFDKAASKFEEWENRFDENYRRKNQNIVIKDGRLERLLSESYITITKASADFDHNKFEELRSKYLKKVNSEIEEEKSKIAVVAFEQPEKLCNPLLEIELGNSKISKNAPLWAILPPLCLYRFSDMEEKLILDRLEKCGVDSAKVKILYGEKKDPRKLDIHVHNDNVLMSVYNSPFTQKSVLTIHNRLLDDLQKGTANDRRLPLILNNGAKFIYSEGRILVRQAVEVMVAHEAAHILHADNIMLNAIRSNGAQEKTVDKIVGLCEKRADLFAVFNSPNPVAAAIMCYRTGTHSNTYHYEKELKELEAELRGCYSLPAKKMNPVPKVEHE